LLALNNRPIAHYWFIAVSLLHQIGAVIKKDQANPRIFNTLQLMARQVLLFFQVYIEKMISV
jgi:hypothetical protein